MTRRTSKLALAVAATLGPFAVGSAHATPQPYTDFDLFKDDLLAAGLSPVRHGFDDAVAGTNLRNATVDGIRFSDFSLNRGVEPIISAGFPSGNTISPPKAIGTTDTPFVEKFGNPDGFRITFASSFAIGMWFLTTTPENVVFADDFTVTTARGSATNGEDVPDDNKFNGGATGQANSGVDGYFVGIIDTVPFEEATISTIEEGAAANAIQFRIDDIYTAAAPAPTSLALLALGAGLMSLQRRRPRSTA